MVIKQGFPSIISFKKWVSWAFVLLLTSGLQSAWAAVDFLVIAPGQNFTAGSAPNRYNPVTQVAGEAFNLSVYCYNDATNNPANSNGVSTTLGSSSAAPSFVPSSPAINQTFATIPNSLFTPIATALFPANTGDYTLTASPGAGGINGDSTTIHVQSISQFQFVVGSFTAGSAGTLTINALDSASNLCDKYNTTTGVHLYALDAGANGATVDLGLIQFTNGVYTSSSITLYHATPYARFQAVKAGAPAVTSTSSVFAISAEGSNNWLVLGPGQTILSGQNSGNGRTGASTATSSQQAGTSFSMTMYVCDAYWNTKTSAASGTLSSSDTTYSNAVNMGGGSSLTLSNVNVHIVGTGTVIMTISGGGPASQTDNVPLSSANLDHFAISTIGDIASTTATTSVVVTAYDVYGNTVTTVGGTTTLAVLQNLIPLPTGVSMYGPTTLTFASGISSNSLFVRAVGVNYSVTITNGLVVSSSTGTFNVLAPGPANRYLVCMPGQTLLPGQTIGGFVGRVGNPSNVTAGVPVGVSVLVTDQYGNKVSAAPPTVTATTLAVPETSPVFSPAAPFVVPANNLLTMTLFKSAQSPSQQRLTISGGTPTSGNSGFFNVVANSVTQFTVGNIGATQTAGTAFNVQITAYDAYLNAVLGYVGPVYVTSPLADYHNPEQSVISVTGGVSGAPTSVTWTVNSGFSNGIWNNNMTVFRAGTANIYVSSNADGTGSTGTSIAFTVVPANMTKVFAIVPGLQYRPGTGGGAGNSLGGYYGNPDAQQVGTPFGVTVYATDLWWNQVPGINYGFHTVSAPTTSNINGLGWNFTNGQFVLSVNLQAPASYSLTMNSDVGGIANYTTPYFISGISVDHFWITSPDGAPSGFLPALLTAGVPFNVTVIAYADSGSTIATTFNGQVNLVTSADYEEPYRAISPQRINLVNGYWAGQVTVFKEVPSLTIQTNFGTSSYNVHNNPTVMHNVRKQMLILAPGMAAKPGISPDTYPPGGFPGYTGNPVIQEAGKPFRMDYFLCDQYWNIVTTTANTPLGGGFHQIRITSSDSSASQDGVTQPITVNLRNDDGQSGGAYNTLQFKLFTVGNNAYQTVTVSDQNDGGVATFTLGGSGGTGITAGNEPPINVRHTDLALVGGPGNTYAFKIQPVAAAGHMMAGVPFWCTITAQDQYGNPMDNRNLATPFPAANNLTLGLGSASNTLYPTVVQLANNGAGSFFLTAYKKYQGVGNSVNANFTDTNGTHVGWSGSFLVDSNVFRRLIPIVNGMLNNEGVYVVQPPTQFLGYSGSPAAQTAGAPVNFQIYACDTYGNITTGSTDLISITTTDQYAPTPQPQQLNWNSGMVDFNNTFRFHHAVPAAITATDNSNGSILSGTSPYMTVNPAAPFGLVTLAGQALVEGSGNSGIPSGLIGGVFAGGWFAGVTPMAIPRNNTIDAYAGGNNQLSGVFFPVTVQATDVYGNHVSINDAFQVQTATEGNGGAVPNVSVPLNGTLSNGTGVVSAKLITTGGQVIFPYDMSSGLNPTGGARSDLNVTTLGNTHFILSVNGVDGVVKPGPVYVQAAPRTFTITVEVHDDDNDLIVNNSNVGFILEVYSNPASSTPGNGTLLVTVGQTLNGGATLTETYTAAETIYIRVKEINGASRPTLRTGPEVVVSAGGPASLELSLDPNFAAGNPEMQANDIKTIYARDLDINHNPVGGDLINFSIADTFNSRLWDGANALTGTASASGGNGIAATSFKAGGNEDAIVEGASSVDSNIKGTLTIHISVTKNGGVYPNPFNPASSDPRNWAHIDYRLDQNAPVKIYIYTLFGDLVWHKEISSGTQGATTGVNTTIWNGKNDNNVTVANGGYIAVVKVNDQKKYQFKIGAFKQK